MEKIQSILLYMKVSENEPYPSYRKIKKAPVQLSLYWCFLVWYWVSDYGDEIYSDKQ